MKIDAIHRDILFKARKAQRGYFSPEKIDDALHEAQMSVYMRRLGNIREFSQVGVPRTGGINVQKISDDLREFIVPPTTFPLLDGKLALPADYVALNALFTEDMREVHIVPADKLAYRLNSAIVRPTAQEPVALLTNVGYCVYPVTIEKVRLSYLRLPKKPKYGYVPTENGRNVEFRENISTDLEWPAIVINEIMMEALVLLSMPVRDGFTAQIAEQKQDKGV